MENENPIPKTAFFKIENGEKWEYFHCYNYS